MLRKRKGSNPTPPNSSGNAEGSAGSTVTRQPDAAQDRKISKGKQLYNSVTKKPRLDFELYFFVFLTVHMLIQNFNIYRLNIYNYNVYLLLFCGLVYSRRLLLVLLGPKMFNNYPNVQLSGITTFGTIVIALLTAYVTFLLTKLYLYYSLKNVVLAVLPLMITAGLDAIQRFYNRNIMTPSIEGVMLMQVKYIVYDTFQATYYTTVLPLRFLQSDYVFYDSARCIVVIFMVALNTLWLLIEGFLFTCFTDVYQYYSAQSVKKINTNMTPSGDGKLTNIRGILFGTCNYYPDDEHLTPWYWAVQYAILNPEKVHTFLIGTELTLIIFQLLLLINSHYWLIYGVMLLLNYSILLLCIYTRRRNIFAKRQYPMNIPTPNNVRPIN